MILNKQLTLKLLSILSLKIAPFAIANKKVKWLARGIKAEQLPNYAYYTNLSIIENIA